MIRDCKIHGETEHVEREGGKRVRCRICEKDQRNKYRKTLRRKAVEYKGGKCQKCGYSKCDAALEFHHLDPEQKDFKISGTYRSWKKIKKEIDKCILVCANCHREIHWNH